MKPLTRRNLLIRTAKAAAGAATATAFGTGELLAQVHASESPLPQSGPAVGRAAPMDSPPAAATVSNTSLAASRAFAFDQMPTRTMANGGESRDIVHGTLPTGETVNLHESTQVAGTAPNPLHIIQHTEFILVREGELEFQHEAAGQLITERVGPGGVLYVAPGTKHTVRNAGSVPAKYFVVAIGGDAK